MKDRYCDEKPLLKNFWNYLKSPYLNVSEHYEWYMKIFNVLRLWSITFFLSLMFAFLSGAILDRVGYQEEEFALNQVFSDLSPLIIIFTVVVWAPVSEELAFRLGLKFSPVRWGISITMLISFAFLMLDIPFLGGYFFDFASWQGIAITLGFLIFLTISISVFLSIKQIKSFFYVLFEKHFKYFYYIFALVFGFIHITNYQDDWFTLVYLSPILVMPQILLSFVISYVRMHYGFVWAVLAHALNNGVIVAILLLFLPIIRIENLEHLNTYELTQNLSPIDVFSVTFGMFFVFGVFLLIFLSIVSLFIEIYRFNRNRPL